MLREQCAEKMKDGHTGKACFRGFYKSHQLCAPLSRDGRGRGVEEVIDRLRKWDNWRKGGGIPMVAMPLALPYPKDPALSPQWEPCI